MNRTQKVIILSWVILIAVVICLYLEWRFAASMMLWVWLFLRGIYLKEKKNCHKYYSKRKGLMIVFILSLTAPFLWFLYRMVSDSDITDIAWNEIGVLSVPLIIMTLIYDRWLYLNHDCRASPR